MSVKPDGSYKFSCKLGMFARWPYDKARCRSLGREVYADHCRAVLAAKETGQGQESRRRLGPQPHRLLSRARRRKLAVRLSASAPCRDPDW
jgi:hypothetical protein